VAAIVDDGNLVFPSQFVAKLVGHDGASQSGTQDDNMRHAFSSLAASLFGTTPTLLFLRRYRHWLILRPFGRLRLDAGQTNAGGNLPRIDPSA
jgi:hypothetical protein